MGIVIQTSAMDLTEENKTIIKEFIEHCKFELQINSKFTIKIIKKGLKDPTAGTFNPSTNVITVCCKNRAVADCLRTIAHEMTHLKQLEDLNGNSFPETDEELQPYENDANVSSGKLVRYWGRTHREIYNDLR
jgi:hypothetical protein